jgi:hypothetical protein
MNKISIRGHCKIIDEDNNIITENHNTVVYSGRELIPNILFGLSDYNIRGFSMGSGGTLYNNPLVPNNVSMTDYELTKTIEAIPSDASENISIDYINTSDTDTPFYSIKKLKEEYINNLPDVNNEGKYLILKLIIPIDKMEYNGTMDSGVYLNEAALWLMDSNYDNKKLFSKSTFSSIQKKKLKPFKYIWTLFF